MNKPRKIKFDKDTCTLHIQDYVFYYYINNDETIQVLVNYDFAYEQITFKFVPETTGTILTKEEKQWIEEDLTKRIRTNQVRLISHIFFENTNKNLMNGKICKNFTGGDWYEHELNY